MRLSLSSLLLLLCGVTVLAADRPNVLFIAIDDLNMNVGCYGNTIVKTPNIDALAAKGVRFDRAYCHYPLCNPSRASLLTGMRPDTVRVYDLQTNLRSTTPDAVTLPEMFRKNGYYVARVGKIFHYGVPRQIGTPGMDDPQSWDYTFNPLGRDKVEEGRIHILTRGTGTTTIGFAMAWLDMDGTDEEQTDGKGVTETLRLLEEHKDKPFFIAMGFYRPHTPFVAPRKWFDLYPLESVKLPEVPADDLADIPDIAFTIRPPNYGLDEKGLRDCVRGYYAATSFLDNQVGRLLEALDRLKLAENTIVVLWSDHGFLLGEHKQWQKQLLFEEACRVPFVIYAPAARSRGGVCPRTVELLDIYPTLAELCHLQPTVKLEGKSLSPLLDQPDAKWDRPALTQVTRVKDGRREMAYSVRNERYRYTEWGRDGSEGRELYDHQKDPHELRNLATDPAHAAAAAEMKSLLPQYTDPPAPAAAKAKKKKKKKAVAD